MDNQRKPGPKAYRFTLTAVAFGETEDDALAQLLDALGEAALEVLDNEVIFEALDYVYVASSSMSPEA